MKRKLKIQLGDLKITSFITNPAKIRGGEIVIEPCEEHTFPCIHTYTERQHCDSQELCIEDPLETIRTCPV